MVLKTAKVTSLKIDVRRDGSCKSLRITVLLSEAGIASWDGVLMKGLGLPAVSFQASKVQNIKQINQVSKSITNGNNNHKM